eukprot:Sspe_Gene.57698::Locus_31656_Transcript_1_5_Confidence_0.571_Length_389::g.57698::m.57698
MTLLQPKGKERNCALDGDAPTREAGSKPPCNEHRKKERDGRGRRHSNDEKEVKKVKGVEGGLRGRERRQRGRGTAPLSVAVVRGLERPLPRHPDVLRLA